LPQTTISTNESKFPISEGKILKLLLVNLNISNFERLPISGGRTSKLFEPKYKYSKFGIRHRLTGNPLNYNLS